MPQLDSQIDPGSAAFAAGGGGAFCFSGSAAF